MCKEIEERIIKQNINKEEVLQKLNRSIQLINELKLKFDTSSKAQYIKELSKLQHYKNELNSIQVSLNTLTSYNLSH